MSIERIENLLELKLTGRSVSASQSGQKAPHEQIHVLKGPKSLALIIPKALYQDEIAKFKKTTTSNKVIDGYLRSMLETISHDLHEIIEDYMGEETLTMVPLIDLKTGFITAFFRIRESLPEAD